MNLAELAAPHNIFVYAVHVVVGCVILALAGVALSAIKGSKRHIYAGRSFVSLGICAGISALIFMSDIGFVPNIFGTSMLAIGVASSSFLALRAPSREVRFFEVIVFFATLSSALVLLNRFVGFCLTEGLLSSAALFTFACASFPLFFVVYDIYFMTRNRQERQLARLKRHVSGMAFVCAVMVHAPVVSVFTDVSVNFFLKFFGPYTIWPAIYYFYFPLLKREATVKSQRAYAKLRLDNEA